MRSSPGPRPRRLLLLPPPRQGELLLPEVVASPALPFERRPVRYEYAGLAFHQWHMRVCGVVAERPSARGPDESAQQQQAEDADDRARRAEYEARKREHGVDAGDFYELLGIGHLGMGATERQIKKAYQATVVRVHPDKNKESPEADEAANAHFRTVQKAYEVLSDPVQRKGYDSQFEFDDWIPKGTEDDKAFFKLYGPVFDSNARFSNIRPVPALGQADDAEAKVRAFYTFWRSFSSWRSFSAEDEHQPSDIETAGSRDERRFMMRENEVAREKRKKDEYKRVQILVERAYANDPRIAKFKLEAERAKEDARHRREAQRLLEGQVRLAELQERERADREERERLEQERKAQAALKARGKKALKRLRDAALAVLAAQQPLPGPAQAAELELALEAVKSLDPRVLKDVADAVEAGRSLHPLLQACAQMKSAAVASEPSSEQAPTAALAPAPAAAAAAAPAKKEKAWTPEAMSLLAKALAKHPGGTRNRWQAIASYLNTAGFPATPEECIAAAKTFGPPGAPRPAAVAAAAPSPEEGEAGPPWTPENLRALEAALGHFPAASHPDKNQRWTLIAQAVKTHSKKQCAAKFKELREKALGAAGKQ